MVPNTGTRQDCTLLCWSMTHAVILLLFSHLLPIKRKFSFVDFLGFFKTAFEFDAFIMRREFDLNIFHLPNRDRVLRLLVNPKTRQV